MRYGGAGLWNSAPRITQGTHLISCHRLTPRHICEADTQDMHPRGYAASWFGITSKMGRKHSISGSIKVSDYSDSSQPRKYKGQKSFGGIKPSELQSNIPKIVFTTTFKAFKQYVFPVPSPLRSLHHRLPSSFRQRLTHRQQDRPHYRRLPQRHRRPLHGIPRQI